MSTATLQTTFAFGDTFRITYQKEDGTVKEYQGPLMPNHKNVKPEVAFTLNTERHPRSFRFDRVLAFEQVG